MPNEIASEQDAREFLSVNVEADWRAALDREAADTALAETIAKIRADLRYFPRSEIDAAVRRATDEHTRVQREKEEEATTARAIHLHDAHDFEAAAEHYRNLPDIVAAFEVYTGKGGTSGPELIGLWNLEAALMPQIDALLTGQKLTAMALDLRHDQLVQGDINEPRANVTLRAIEARRDDLLSIVAPFDPLREPEQESALRRLRERIASSREPRVPDVIKQAIEAVKDGKRQLEKVRSVRKLQLVSRATLAEVRQRAER